MGASCAPARHGKMPATTEHAITKKTDLRTVSSFSQK